MKLGAVADINPRRISAALNDTDDVSFVPMSAVSEVTGTIEAAVAKPFGDVKKGYTCFSDGDILFAKVSPCMQNGKHAIAWDLINGVGFGSTEFHVIRPGPLVLAEWIHYFLRRQDTLQAAIKTFNGAVGLQRVPSDFLESLEIPVPSLDVQRNQVDLLRRQLAAVEEARQAAQAQVKDADALKAALYRCAFQGVVPVALPLDLEDAPAGWCWTKLADLARLESGHTPSRARPDWWGGDISWLSLTEIRALDGQWVKSTEIRTNEAGIANSSARILPRGTVCFSRTASVGFVALMAEPMATSQDFANWVCGDDLDPEFLMYALIRARTELRALATGATHKTIYMPMLGSFHLCLPDRATQGAIVRALKAQLAAAEEARQAAQAQLDEIKRLPGRLLAQAFDSNHPQ
ncbi:restriction endonuclease subunit S [Sphaerotilus sp.]|uniref:restriction endonuclease subunit S n=1 Tax=Sphaerotilus sp. TaxID=2093942 RepID=UPI0025E87C4E|nr:restriction endonuclease subunit S [Sphaerotilus sp.]